MIRYLCILLILTLLAGGCKRKDEQSQQKDGVKKEETQFGLKLVSPLKHGEKIPDAELINQNGKTIRLSDYKGKLLVLTFIYTRCNLPSMCPMITLKFKELQDSVLRRMLSPVQFLIISFDTKYDKPKVLKEFADCYRAELSNWDFATGKAEDIGQLARAFNIYYRQDQKGIFDHNIITAVIDRKGIFRDDFFGTEWDTKEFISVLESLLKERD